MDFGAVGVIYFSNGHFVNFKLGLRRDNNNWSEIKGFLTLLKISLQNNYLIPALEHVTLRKIIFSNTTFKHIYRDHSMDVDNLSKQGIHVAEIILDPHNHIDEEPFPHNPKLLIYYNLSMLTIPIDCLMMKISMDFSLHRLISQIVFLI